MIKFKIKGDFRKLNKFLEVAKTGLHSSNLDQFGQQGVAALQAATPIDTGKTSQSWSYKIVRSPGTVKIQFFNSNIQNGVPIAIILQYGHGLKGGGWVEGYDYINPALKTVFESLANDAWREVVD